MLLPNVVPPKQNVESKYESATYESATQILPPSGKFFKDYHPNVDSTSRNKTIQDEGRGHFLTQVLKDPSKENNDDDKPVQRKGISCICQ